MRSPGATGPGRRARSGPAAGRTGHLHETAFYSSDDELLALVVPFLVDGVEAGEPTLAAFGERNQQLVRAALPRDAPVTFLPGADQYARPASTIRSYQQMLAAYAAAGASQVRVVGDVPHPGIGASWGPWARYEAAVNHAYDRFPLWGLCPYDTRTTPDDVLVEVARTHPYLATADGGHHANEAFVAPDEFLRGRLSAPPDPAEAATPDVELTGPTPAAARAAVSRLGRATALRSDVVEDLVVAVSEVVTNALAHGHPPVVLRAWADDGRLVTTVEDGGGGPDDPFVGLEVGGSGAEGGFGLWLAHQLCDEVSLRTGPDGFTVCLVAGRDGASGRQAPGSRRPNQRWP